MAAFRIALRSGGSSLYALRITGSKLLLMGMDASVTFFLFPLVPTAADPASADTVGHFPYFP